jgi:hypothetical protein
VPEQRENPPRHHKKEKITNARIDNSRTPEKL